MTYEQILREEQARLRAELLAAAADEHRLHQLAARERQDESRWRLRADFARVRSLADLAAEAEARADRHAALAQRHERDYEDRRQLVEYLREAVRSPAPPPSAASLSPDAPEPISPERRLNDLEMEAQLEQDLTAMKQRAAARRDPPVS